LETSSLVKTPKAHYRTGSKSKARARYGPRTWDLGWWSNG